MAQSTTSIETQPSTETKDTFAKHDMKNTPLYSFENKSMWARVLSVHDGDTITCAIESFPGAFFRYNVRLDGIDTSEMTSKDERAKSFAEQARNRLIAYLTRETVQPKGHCVRSSVVNMFSSDVYLVYLTCSKMDKYGRVLAKVTVHPKEESANDMLLREGYATQYDGGKKTMDWTTEQ
jgi:endonuclease YncB( thermonuclease family)